MTKTRTLLEENRFFRMSVEKAEVSGKNAFSLTLKTTAKLTLQPQVDSGKIKISRYKETQKGSLRFDFLTDRIVRVRYFEKDRVHRHDTLLVTGNFKGPSVLKVKEDQSSVSLTTSAIRMTVTLEPFRILVTDRKGNKFCGVGGTEKNSFNQWDSLNTGVCRDFDEKETVAVENFDLAPDEKIYGFGEHFLGLDKRGQTIDLDMADALGVITPRAYKNIPFYISNKGYGLFFNHTSCLTYWVGSRSATDVQVAVQDEFLDYYLIFGSIKEILSQYTDITGKGSLPPKWSFGFWQSKVSYGSAEETLEVACKMRENKIPFDVLHLDTNWFKKDWYCDLEFGQDRFPDTAAYITKMAGMGVKISLWQLPYVPAGSRYFEDLKVVDGFVKDKNGRMYKMFFSFFPKETVIGCIDFTNPKAIKVYQNYLRRLFRLRVKVIKTDFGESAPSDGIYHDGTPGKDMHNLYPLLYNKAVFEVTRAETGEGIVWSRSAWAGNQRYPLHWGGDNTPNFYNLFPQLCGGLSFGLSGFQFWSQDIGGFSTETNGILLARWMQFGLFNSHSRIHGVGDREIYKFDRETQRICKKYLNLRYRLMPYIYRSAAECVKQSLPMMRALVIEFQDDPTAAAIADQYLFGRDILVAPVFDETGRRKVYLPKGVWTDWWTHKRISGPGWFDVAVDLETMPIYIREGGIIPLCKTMQYVDQEPLKSIDVLLGAFEEEGENYFEVPVNNKFVSVSYRLKDGVHRVRIGKSPVRFVVTVPGVSPDRLKVVNYSEK